jgi:Domain of unknown function (DUF3510)
MVTPPHPCAAMHASHVLSARCRSWVCATTQEASIAAAAAAPGCLQALLAAVDRLVADASGLDRLLAQRMLAAASSWLRHVRSIATTYRMTTRPPPSKPSLYVGSLLRAPVVRLCLLCSVLLTV